MQLGLTVRELSRRAHHVGQPLRRETLSRVLNGKQPTTWATAERMADILGIDLAGLTVEGGDPNPSP